MRRLNRKRFDALSISNYVIKKGCSHGARHGQSEEKIYNHQAFHAWKRCQKKKDAKGGFRVDEFSRGKLIKNQNTIDDLMAKVPELHNS